MYARFGGEVVHARPSRLLAGHTSMTATVWHEDGDRVRGSFERVAPRLDEVLDPLEVWERDRRGRGRQATQRQA